MTDGTTWNTTETSAGPGTPESGSSLHLAPIILEDVTVTDVALSGYGLRLSLINSHFSGTAISLLDAANNLIQFNVDANSSLTLTMNQASQDYGHHTYNSYGKTSFILGANHFHNVMASTTINLGLTGSFSISSTLVQSVGRPFTVNAELGDTTSGSLFEGNIYQRELLTLENFTITGEYDVNLTDADGSWTLVENMDALKAATAEGKYYFLDSSNSSGATLYTRVIPEPATASLSLLALAGLAARRRRK